MEEKVKELRDLESTLSEVDTKHQHYLIKCKLYRKSELIDLISAVDKLGSENPSYNEMQFKKEKMQSELAKLEEELFDLMKN